jgi:cation diffusion facilitator family transporter
MSQSQRYRITRKTGLISAGINSILALLKLIFGLLGQSQALIADGLHSFSDLLADGLILLAAKAASRGPDEDHPYGHQRIETLASIVIALMLVAIGCGLIYESIEKIGQHAALTRPSTIVIIVAAVSVIMNELLFRYCRNKGQEINSPLLIANAWHNRSDAWSSLIVIISAGGSMLGFKMLDPIGAIIIAVLILKMAWSMVYQNANELLDAAVDEGSLKQIIQTIEQCDGVVAAHQTRTRLHSGNILVDAHIIVDQRISVSEGHFIGEQVEARLKKHNSSITDVIIHIDSEDDELYPTDLGLATRTEVLQSLQKIGDQLPGFNDRSIITLHYLNNALHIDITLNQDILLQHDTVDLQQRYKEKIKKLDFTADVSLLFKP